MGRFFHILGLLIKYSFIYLRIKIGNYKKPKEKLLRNFFEEAGGSFIKFGQILSLRVDLLPREYILELLDLLDNVKAFPYKQVEETFLQELGDRPEKIFETFDKNPYASASFGQVHLATIDGERVVVKIRRPGIENQIGTDFIFIHILAFLGDLFFKIKAMPWRELAAEFERWTKEELNYLREAENTEKIYRTQNNPNIIIPKIYFRYCTRKILVQAFVEGTSLSRLLRDLKKGIITKESLLEDGIDITKTMRLVCEEMLRQYFFTGFYHADPHPGNIIVLRGNKVGIVDFGILGSAIPGQKALVEMFKVWADLNSRETSYRLLVFGGGEMRQLLESALPANIPEGEIDSFIKTLGYKFAESLDEDINKTAVELKSLKTDYLAAMFRYLRFAESYRLRLPKEMGAFFRAIGIIGFVAKELDREFFITQEFKDFLSKYNEEDFLPNEISVSKKRIDRSVALERLANWLGYLAERNPKVFRLVSDYLATYLKA